MSRIVVVTPGFEFLVKGRAARVADADVHTRGLGGDRRRDRRSGPPRPARAAVATVTGEIDLHTAPGLRTRALELIDQGHHHLILDLSGVGFCDSAGLSALIGIWHGAQEAGGSLALATVPDRLMRMLTLTGVDSLLPHYPSTADALSAHQGAPDAA